MLVVEVTHPGDSGKYVQRLEELKNIIDGEFDGAEAGFTLQLVIKEMPDAEYEAFQSSLGGKEA